MRHLVALVTTAVLLAVAPPLYAQPGGATVTILHFNDVYEIAPIEAGRAGGLARVSNFRARLKAQIPNLITTLGGDYVSPSALGTARVNGERLNGKQMVAVLNVIGLDWATLGNHEFDIPEAAFRARLAESKFKIVASNVTDASGAPFSGTVPTAIVPVKTPSGTIRLGLIGLTIDSNIQPWVRYKPSIETARAAIAELKGKCDAIVALTHLSLDEDRQLAEQVSEIDLILGGHEHENWIVERGEHFTPIVKADANVRSLAIVTLRFPKKGARPIVSARLQRIDDTLKEGPKAAAEVRKWTELGFDAFRKDGFNPADVVARIDVPLYGRENAVRNGSTGLTELICEAMRREAGTDFAVFNSGSIRIDDIVPPGPVTQYDVIRILPFGGKILKATFTGALLIRTLQVGQQNKGSGGYLQTAGLPTIIDPNGRYTLAISDFLLTGQEANLGFLTRQNPDITNITEMRDIRMAVIDELKRRWKP
jgi:5'-nucleotidase/UDP-sugar diphosphatase